MSNDDKMSKSNSNGSLYTTAANSAPKLEYPGQESSETGLIEECIETILETVQALIKKRSSASNVQSRKAYSRLKNEADMLFLWKDGLQLPDGKLEFIIQTSEHLMQSTFAALFSMLKLFRPAILGLCSLPGVMQRFSKLLERICLICPKLDSSSGDNDILSQGEDFGARATNVGLSAKTPEIESEEDDEDDDDDEVLVFEEFVEDFQQLSEDFRELAPIVRDYINEFNNKNVEIPAPVIQEIVLSSFKPEHYFHQKLAEEYPRGQKRLLERTANQCWKLYCSAKEALTRRAAMGEGNGTEQGKAIQSDKPDYKSATHDATYKSMLPSIAAPSLVETLRGRAAEPSAQQRHSYARSVATTESAFEGPRPKVPLPPSELAAGDPFVCNICCRRQTNIDNSLKWRKHVLSDIYPYICTFQGCAEGKVRFSNREQWITHEFDTHRKAARLVCIVDNCDEPESKYEDEVAFYEEHLREYHAGLVLSPDLSFRGKHKPQAMLRLAKLLSKTVWEIPTVTTECPFCGLEIEHRKSKVASHVGGHLEDIALNILSFVLGDDNEAGAGETDSGAITASSSETSSLLQHGKAASESPGNNTHVRNTTQDTTATTDGEYLGGRNHVEPSLSPLVKDSTYLPFNTTATGALAGSEPAAVEDDLEMKGVPKKNEEAMEKGEVDNEEEEEELSSVDTTSKVEWIKEQIAPAEAGRKDLVELKHRKITESRLLEEHAEAQLNTGTEADLEGLQPIVTLSEISRQQLGGQGVQQEPNAAMVEEPLEDDQGDTVFRFPRNSLSHYRGHQIDPKRVSPSTSPVYAEAITGLDQYLTNESQLFDESVQDDVQHTDGEISVSRKLAQTATVYPPAGSRTINTEGSRFTTQMELPLLPKDSSRNSGKAGKSISWSNEMWPRIEEPQDESILRGSRHRNPADQAPSEFLAPRTRRRHSPCEIDWESHRPIIETLYSQNTLKEVMAIMADDYGVVASEQQFKKQMRKWTLYKYHKLDDSQRDYIRQKTIKHRQQGENTSFRLNDKQLNDAKIQRTLRKKWGREDIAIDNSPAEASGATDSHEFSSDTWSPFDLSSNDFNP